MKTRFYTLVYGIIFLWSFCPTADDFVVVPVQVAPMVRRNVQNVAAASPRGDAQQDGNATSRFTPQNVTVTIPLVEHINLDQKEYTIKEPASCKGTKWILDERFIRVHEDTHVAQIEAGVRTALNGQVSYQ